MVSVNNIWEFNSNHHEKVLVEQSSLTFMYEFQKITFEMPNPPDILQFFLLRKIKSNG